MRDYGFLHLSAGDLLREEVASGSEKGKEIDGLMKEGKIVPQEVTIALLKAAMSKSSTKKFLIDGFPRKLDQAEIFESEVCPPLFFILLFRAAGKHGPCLVVLLSTTHCLVLPIATTLLPCRCASAPRCSSSTARRPRWRSV